MNENDYKNYDQNSETETAGFEKEKQQYYQPGMNRKEKKRSAGGYIATSLISMIVGALLAILLVPNTGLYFETEVADAGYYAEGSLFPFFSQFPDMQAEKGSETPAPEKIPGAATTPKPTERPAANYDGAAPVVDETVTNPIPDVVEQVSNAIVGVNGYIYSDYYEKEVVVSYGSGFFISSEGYIMTNAHVVEGWNSVTISLPDGTEVDAELMGADKTLDVAVLKVDPSGLDFAVLAIGDSESLRVGDFVLAIGDPTGPELACSTTFGIVSAIKRPVNLDGITNEYIQTDAALNPGSSGCALLNMKGEVVGMVVAKKHVAAFDEYGDAIDAEGIGYAIPINEAKIVADKLITKGYIDRPGLGISIVQMDADMAEEYGVVPGILVYTVTKGGSGDLGGLKVGDVILSCDGMEVDQDGLVAYIKSKFVGDTVTLEIWRNGEELSLELPLVNLNDLGGELVGGEFEGYSESDSASDTVEDYPGSNSDSGKKEEKDNNNNNSRFY